MVGPLPSIITCVGIPIKYFPEDPEKMPAVQYAALIADLVVKTKQTLGYISNQKDEKATQFEYLRLRTKQDTEMIVTNYVAAGNEYILVVN